MYFNLTNYDIGLLNMNTEAQNLLKYDCMHKKNFFPKRSNSKYKYTFIYLISDI